MTTTLQQVRNATGTEKILILATSIDNLIEDRSARGEGSPIDEQIQTLDVRELAEQYEISFETLRKQITESAGDGAVFKLGKKWVIRKRKFLEFLQAKETRSIAE